MLALAIGSHDQEWNCIAYAPNTRRSTCDIELDVCGLAGGTALHFDISSSFCTTVASFVLNAQTRAAGRRLNSMPRRTDSTYARCGLAETTIAYYSTFATDFLQDRFGDGRVNLSRLRASDVIRFVQLKAQRLHLKRAKLMTTALRSFLRYARYRGDMVPDLADFVPVVANWSMPSIPRAIAPDQIRQLLSSIDRRTGMGLRDYAILLLLARLGLRSGEVVSLELTDIDWSAARLTVRGKCGQRNELPLHADVGKAIAAYLRHGRPHSSCRRVFLRTKAPITGFRGACGVGSIVRHALQRAGIDAPTTGAHQFRHGLAADMLRHGASLSEIGEILGHRDPQTTMIYT
ncbi:tyrosine-type recombinase/integrase [Paraburkholderia sp. BCC1885]|uniref:tyrosine-type recombinase/integrase n=1 Tax=Paraburkholderia sp. BCC1885 TaxID=2562669 RepID=UPI00118312C6|nr:tyrosine-type recombinase/integrase [Paraburkholderia sp. BCC1885]